MKQYRLAEEDDVLIGMGRFVGGDGKEHWVIELVERDQKMEVQGETEVHADEVVQADDFQADEQLQEGDRGSSDVGVIDPSEREENVPILGLVEEQRTDETPGEDGR